MKQLYAISLGFAGTLLLSGCTGSPLQSPDDGHFTLNTRQMELCYSRASTCYRLRLVDLSARKLTIAKAYGVPSIKSVANASRLSRLMLEPPQQAYPIETLEPNLYRLPITPETLSVWQLLEGEYLRYYAPSKDVN